MNWPRAIIHLDMDTFFVSVERKHNPALIGKPVIVGGGRGGELRRSVVCACSYETRPFGVHSAMPMVQAVRLCPNAILVPVGTSDYGAETARVRAILAEFTDQFEMTSPDEAYVDLAGTELLHGSPIDAAHKLREAITHRTGVPCSVGLSTSKTVSKIASKLSKPGGMFVVLPGGEASILRPLKIRSLPGLGKKTAATLEHHAIRTLGQLGDQGVERMVHLLGDHGASLWRRAQGICNSAVEPDRERVQISTETTFGEDVGDAEQLRGLLARMTAKLGERLRARGQWAGTITIKIRYPDFSTHTRQSSLQPPSHHDRELLIIAEELLKTTWDRRTPLRLIGVGVSGLTDTVQQDLISSKTDEKQERLLAAMDRIRETKGRAALGWANAVTKRTTPAKPSRR